MPTAQPRSLGRGVGSWLSRHEGALLILNGACVTMLFVGFLFTSTIRPFPADMWPVVQVGSIILIGLVVLSLVSKGLVPIVLSLIGAAIIYHAVTFPLHSAPDSGDDGFVRPYGTEQAVKFAILRHFFLGAGMMAFGTILAYRPSMLFTRGRPKSSDEEWSKYQLWHDGSLVMGYRTEQLIPVQALMTEEDRRLLWRYECVLASIYGTTYLVLPDGSVPSDSTVLLRDRETGRILGKEKFPGYFI